MKTSLSRMLSPESIAIIGANEGNTYAGRFMKILTDNRYSGKIYPVNPSRDEVMGLKCHASLDAIEDDVDLAVVIVKAELVKGVVSQCAAKKVGSILIITSGFSEADPVAGRQLEREIAKIASDAGIHVLGPNTAGLANIEMGFWGSIVSTVGVAPLKPGRAALVSQSGSSGFGALLSAAKDRGVGLKYIVTTGNEADLDLVDLVDAMLDDPDIDVVAAFIEGIKSVEKFIQVAKKAGRLNKSIAALKIGESAVGSRAAASHTASMTGDMAVFNAMARQYGVLKAEDYSELMEMTKVAQMKYQLKGKRVCILSHSGGIVGFTGDVFGKYGFDVPVLSDRTQEMIEAYTKGFGSTSNPVDLTGAYMRGEAVVEIVKEIDKNNEIDAYIFATHGSNAQMVNPIRAIESVEKPCYIVWPGSIYEEGLELVREKKLFVSFSAPMLARTLMKCLESREVLLDEPAAIEGVSLEIPEKTSEYLNEVVSKSILSSQLGISVPEHKLIEKVDDLQKLKQDKRYAMKIVSDTVIHKSDIGGVVLNLGTPEEHLRGYEALESLKAGNPEICGIFAEEMAEDGLDLVVGLREDVTFGWILMVGLGGINTELFKMISIRSIPVGRAEIERMLLEVPGLGRLLAGYRGQPPYDHGALVTAIERLCSLVWQNRAAFDLLEINPLRVMPRAGGVIALDCVMKLKQMRTSEGREP